VRHLVYVIIIYNLLLLSIYSTKLIK